MPIMVPNELPAKQILQKENIFIMEERRATSQDIRPLKIVLLNLMPRKEQTEAQLLRMLSNTPLQVQIVFVAPASHTPKSTSAEHLNSFYTTFEEIKNEKYDGMIVTGAPVETLPFEEVIYWQELTDIFEWSKTHVTSTFHICWGAQAGLYYHYGVRKIPLQKKMFGVFKHRLLKEYCPLLRGFDHEFMVPHSRHTTVLSEEIMAVEQLEILSVSDMAGVYIVQSSNGRQIFVTGHSEYDALSLRQEYERDYHKGMSIDLPVNYYPDDNPYAIPESTWRSHAHLLYSNWLNYYVYQVTPYEIEKVGQELAEKMTPEQE